MKKVKTCMDCGTKVGFYAKRCRKCYKLDASIKRRWKGNPAYIDGRTVINNSIRSLSEYKSWRLEVFKRDYFTCSECGDNSGNNLNAHHKYSFILVLS